MPPVLKEGNGDVATFGHGNVASTSKGLPDGQSIQSGIFGDLSVRSVVSDMVLAVW